MPAVGGPFDTDQEQPFEGRSQSAELNGGPEYVASWLHLRRLRKGIELADQAITVFFGRCSQMGDEGFDQIAAGLLKCFGTAEVGGVGLHEVRIEVVLADQKAELIAETRLAILSGRCYRTKGLV